MSAVITLVGGVVFLMWIGEQVTARGIGNGISLIIFAGIVAELPSALVNTLELGATRSTINLVNFGCFGFGNNCHCDNCLCRKGSKEASGSVPKETTRK